MSCSFEVALDPRPPRADSDHVDPVRCSEMMVFRCARVQPIPKVSAPVLSPWRAHGSHSGLGSVARAVPAPDGWPSKRLPCSWPCWLSFSRYSDSSRSRGNWAKERWPHSTSVYLGVHYPSDVLAGWCGGLIWALTCWLVARYLQYRGAVDRAGRV